MQEYLQKTRLSGVMDSIGFHAAAALGSLGWFCFLWGLRPSALTAGLALYGLLLLLRRKIRDDCLSRREKALRAAIGGEMALDRLLLSPPHKAHFEAAVLLSLRCPLTLLKAAEEGVLCGYHGKKLLLAFAQLPSGGSVDAGCVLKLQRDAKIIGAEQGILCAPCKISPEARAQAASDPLVHILSREKMISLFGAANPATDDQLVALGRRKKARKPGKWRAWIFHPQRAKKYAWYGALLLFLYTLTHLIYYALPGMVCVLFATVCRCVRQKEFSLFDTLEP